MNGPSSTLNPRISAQIARLTSPDEQVRREAVGSLVQSLESGILYPFYSELATLALVQFAFGPMSIDHEKSVARYDADEFLQSKVSSFDEGLIQQTFSTIKKGVENAWKIREEILDPSAPRIVADSVELALRSFSRWGLGYLTWLARYSDIPGSNYAAATKAVQNVQHLLPYEEKHHSTIQEFKGELGLLMASLAFREPLEIIEEQEGAQNPVPKGKFQFASAGPLAMLFSHRTADDLAIERYQFALKTASKERWNFLSSLHRAVELISSPKKHDNEAPG